MSSRITVNDYLKVERNAKCIKYEKIINTPKNKEHLLISHDEVNKYDFSKGLLLKMKSLFIYILILILLIV